MRIGGRKINMGDCERITGTRYCELYYSDCGVWILENKKRLGRGRFRIISAPDARKIMETAGTVRLLGKFFEK